MVAMGIGSTTKRAVVWCVGLLVAGLLLVAVDADFCSEDCRGKLDFWGCVRGCRSHLEVAWPTNCIALCHGKPNFMACCNRHRYVRRALLHLKLAGRESATHEDVLTAMAARLSDACQDLCHNHEHYDWCVRRCRFGPHLRLAGGESEEASGGAVDVPMAMAAVDPRVCEDFCRNWPAPDHDWCLDFCLIGGAPPHLKLAGGESAAHEEEGEEASGGAVDVPQEAAAAAAAGAQPMKNTDPCEDYCVEQTRYFPRPGQFFDCVEECHAGHGRLAGDGGNGTPPAAAAVAQLDAAAGAQPVNTDTCETYCKRHARDFPAKYKACVRQCQAGGHPGDGALVEQERHKKHGEVHLRRGTGKIAIQ